MEPPARSRTRPAFLWWLPVALGFVVSLRWLWGFWCSVSGGGELASSFQPGVHATTPPERGPGPCSADSDCDPTQWCQLPAPNAGRCLVRRAAGELCSRSGACRLGLVCSASSASFVASGEGRCRRPCEVNADCEEGHYCGADYTCRGNSTCSVSSDCAWPGNDFARPTCRGAALVACERLAGEGVCRASCGNSACMDWEGFEAGACGEALGWGIDGGACVLLTGCPHEVGRLAAQAPGSFRLFASEVECRAACSPAAARL